MIGIDSNNAVIIDLTKDRSYESSFNNGCCSFHSFHNRYTVVQVEYNWQNTIGARQFCIASITM